MGSKRISIDEIKKRLFKAHKNTVSIVDLTFKGVCKHATFVDSEYGEWEAIVKTVLNGTRHPGRWNELRTFDIETIKRKIFKVHGNKVKIKEETYTKTRNKATFIDEYFGEWKCTAILVLRGHGHPKRADLKHRIPIEQIKKRIFDIHGNEVSIVENTYSMVARKAIFIDTQFGEFECLVNSVLHGTGHSKRILEKSEKTSLQRYGFKNVSQNPIKALEAARKTNIKYIRFHWKTNEELVCQGSWEAKVVDYLNSNQINFEWQPKVFGMPSGKTYRPDFYLVDSDIWIEIKGYMRPKSKEKWDWFKSEHPTAELWNKDKLKELRIL